MFDACMSTFTYLGEGCHTHGSLMTPPFLGMILYRMETKLPSLGLRRDLSSLCSLYVFATDFNGTPKSWYETTTISVLCRTTVTVRDDTQGLIPWDCGMITRAEQDPVHTGNCDPVQNGDQAPVTGTAA